MLVLKRAVRATDTNIFHDHLRRVIPTNGHFLIFLQVNHVLVELLFPVLNLIVLELCVGWLELAEVQE